MVLYSTLTIKLQSVKKNRLKHLPKKGTLGVVNTTRLIGLDDNNFAFLELDGWQENHLIVVSLFANSTFVSF